ncbi:MAG: hypothetical protein QM612_08370 [Thermomonas sp.]|uniref:hypothetical protein n=1 Tax=Thermomonas sp. TaxID=1971895 RepID=UPI0039E407E8
MSNVSEACLFESQPSRHVGVWLLALAVLAPFCLIASNLPRGWAWPLACVALIASLRDMRNYLRQPVCTLRIPAGRGAVTSDDAHIDDLRLRWRGPLAFFDWRDGDGRRRRLVFWPDRLPAATRRELKLAMQRREAAIGMGSVTES